MNLAQMVNLNARKYPDRVCVRYNGSGLTFGELKDRAERAAGLLQGLGIMKGDKVAIMSQNTPDFVTAFFGIIKAGGVVVPINHKLMAPEVEYILQHSEARILFFDGALESVISKLSSPIKKLSMDTEPVGYEFYGQLLDTSRQHEEVEISDDDFAEILYTSGTTGKPKGCLHTHRSVIMAGITGALAVKIGEQDVTLMAMPIWHSSPLNNWFIGTQYVGGTVVLIREYHPLHFLQAIQSERCTVYFGARFLTFCHYR